MIEWLRLERTAGGCLVQFSAQAEAMFVLKLSEDHYFQFENIFH